LELPRDRYGEVFDGVFVQRTRSRLEAQKTAVDFPERRVHADNAPASEAYDGLFAVLANELPRLRVPYREPFLALQRSATKLRGGGLDDAESNLERSFLTQLYKRAESSLFALATSLETIKARLLEFRDLLAELRDRSKPKEALNQYLREHFVKIEPIDDDEDEQGPEPAALASDQKARLSRVAALMETLDDKSAREVLDGVNNDQIVADLEIVDRIQRRLTFDLDEQSPKDLLLLRRAREAYARGYKPILVAGYADTAMRSFLRVIDAMPEARVALVLGNGQAWLHRPDRHNRKPLKKAEWETGRALQRGARAAAWIIEAQRGVALSASDALDAFAPRARLGSEIRIEQLGGESTFLLAPRRLASATIFRTPHVWCNSIFLGTRWSSSSASAASTAAVGDALILIARKDAGLSTFTTVGATRRSSKRYSCGRGFVRVPPARSRTRISTSCFCMSCTTGFRRSGKREPAKRLRSACSGVTSNESRNRGDAHPSSLSPLDPSLMR
jgi:hypothetical protein